MDIIRDLLKDAMIGTHTHINLFQALENLTDEEAKAAPIKNSNSTFDILYHMISWQDVLFKNISGEKIDWKDIVVHKKDWPDAEFVKNITWEELKGMYKESFKKLEEKLKTVDIEQKLDSLMGAPILKAFLIINQHNSYHIGQISKNRNAQGNWPPTK